VRAYDVESGQLLSTLKGHGRSALPHATHTTATNFPHDAFGGAFTIACALKPCRLMVRFPLWLCQYLLLSSAVSKISVSTTEDRVLTCSTDSIVMWDAKVSSVHVTPSGGVDKMTSLHLFKVSAFSCVCETN
jgi:hypothetical protein